MSKIKNHLKKKSSIIALIFMVAGIMCLLITPLVPHGKTYRSTSNPAIGGDSFHSYIEFIDKNKLKTYNKYDVGHEIFSTQIKDYKIKDGVLYIENLEFGKIDSKYIERGSIISGNKKTIIGYECIATKIARYLSYFFIVLGGYLFIQPLIKPAKKKTKTISNSNNQIESNTNQPQGQ